MASGWIQKPPLPKGFGYLCTFGSADFLKFSPPSTAIQTHQGQVAGSRVLGLDWSLPPSSSQSQLGRGREKARVLIKPFTHSETAARKGGESVPSVQRHLPHPVGGSQGWGSRPSVGTEARFTAQTGSSIVRHTDGCPCDTRFILMVPCLAAVWYP